MSHESEEELLQKVQSGDHEAFRGLVELHELAVFKLVMRQVGDSTLAHEITHDSFVQGYLQIKKFRKESAFRTWLIRIALNQIHAHFRKKQHEEFSPEKHGGAVEQSDLQEEQVKEKRAERLRAAVQKLSLPLKEAYVLSGFEGKSYEEVSVALDIPLGTVRSRLNQARIKLRELLLSDEVFHECA